MPLQIGTSLSETCRIFPIDVYGKYKDDDTNKIILPDCILVKLVNMVVQYPMMFSITNERTGKMTHCGVYEFCNSTPPHSVECYVPSRIMKLLELNSGDNVKIKNVSLRAAESITILYKNITDSSNTIDYGFIHEYIMKFDVLNKGDVFDIIHEGNQIQLTIKKLYYCFNRNNPYDGHVDGYPVATINNNTVIDVESGKIEGEKIEI